MYSVRGGTNVRAATRINDQRSGTGVENDLSVLVPIDLGSGELNT